jgi:post-segregation antitoxin (ccd killing protein)
LADIVVALTGKPLLQKQANQELRRARNQQWKQELLEILATVPELVGERDR